MNNTRSDLIEIYRLLHTNREHTFLSSTHGTSMKIDPEKGHEGSLQIFKRFIVIETILSDYNVIKSAVNHKKLQPLCPFFWKLRKEVLRNNSWVMEVIIEIRKYLELNPNENITHQNMAMQPKLDGEESL